MIIYVILHELFTNFLIKFCYFLYYRDFFQYGTYITFSKIFTNTLEVFFSVLTLRTMSKGS